MAAKDVLLASQGQNLANFFNKNIANKYIKDSDVPKYFNKLYDITQQKAKEGNYFISNPKEMPPQLNKAMMAAKITVLENKVNLNNATEENVKFINIGKARTTEKQRLYSNILYKPENKNCKPNIYEIESNKINYINISERDMMQRSAVVGAVALIIFFLYSIVHKYYYKMALTPEAAFKNENILDIKKEYFHLIKPNLKQKKIVNCIFDNDTISLNFFYNYLTTYHALVGIFLLFMIILVLLMLYFIKKSLYNKIFMQVVNVINEDLHKTKYSLLVYL
jgi:hypothetical protein